MHQLSEKCPTRKCNGMEEVVSTELKDSDCVQGFSRVQWKDNQQQDYDEITQEKVFCGNGFCHLCQMIRILFDFSSLRIAKRMV